ncbi:hypothetical protein K469DRAFT_726674 [Zopfia rhizophila CBS 207.26]|uniref:Uncharacterized protein n=1 Tax=Zopfia rhizophila CBS 207.26 TaxID=1314779 RepID=A0A6A6E4S8_9PEZI|nr:hypothetical protein K469DRAFT_726674 [Zopfia rhizophila CBS 207.26]
MTSSLLLSLKLFTRDLAAYSDAELDQYLEESGRVVEVEDPENLPENFIQRLRDRTRRISEKEAYRKGLHRQTEAYHALINNGGRPSHPLSLLKDIVKNLGEYREILSFWQDRGKPEDWKVFIIQLSRWEDFRRLQRFARGHRRFAGYRIGGRGIDDEDDWQYLWRRKKEDYSDEQIESFVGRQQPTTNEEGRFPMYVRAVKDRLTKHGFTRTFQLDEDPARQDRLTTWIEYLGYEYWWYDQYALSKRQQQRLDNAWKKLVDAKVLRPFETQEFICSIESGFLERSERERAEEAVESAKSAVMLVEAQSGLDAAEKEYDSIKRRHSLIYEFTERTKNNRILLRWMLQQLPLIELELKQSDTARDDSNGEVDEPREGQDPAVQRRLDAPTSQGGVRQRPSGRPGHNGQNRGLSDRKTSKTTAVIKAGNLLQPLNPSAAALELRKENNDYVL